MCAGESKVLLPSGAAGALRFQRQGVFGLTPWNIPGQAPLHAPSPLCPPLVNHVWEPVTHDGVDVDFAGFVQLQLDSSKTSAPTGAAGAARAARAAGVLTWAISS